MNLHSRLLPGVSQHACAVTGGHLSRFDSGGLPMINFAHEQMHRASWPWLRGRSLCRDPSARAKAKVSRAEAEARSKREQLAQAAEARMARLQLASQQQQLWWLPGWQAQHACMHACMHALARTVLQPS